MRKSDPLAKVWQNTHKYSKVIFPELKSKVHNYNNIIVSYLSINSVRNKYDDLKLMIDENVDILHVLQISKLTNLSQQHPTG